MSFKLKSSLLAAALVSAVAATQAKATFSYDLRFAPNQTVAGATFVDAHNVDITGVGGSYSVQLWAQITGDTTQTNDGWVYGYVNAINSAQTSGGAFTGGGMNSTAPTMGTHAQATPNPGFQTGTGGVDTNADSIADWGNALSSSTVKNAWFKWAGAAAPGYIPGATGDTESQSAGTNTWEVLVGTFTITPGGVLGADAAKTSFTPFETTQVKLSGTSTVNATVVLIDTAPTPGTATNTVFSNAGVNFIAVANNIPEPASLGVLGLGALALLARRRK